VPRRRCQLRRPKEEAPGKAWGEFRGFRSGYAFASRNLAALEAEILVLRHQLNVLRRKSTKRLAFSNIDRLVFAGLYRMAPAVLDALKILKPQTVIRWHRAGFRSYWRWKSRPHGGRPKTPADIRQLIRDMSIANPLWGSLHDGFVLTPVSLDA
jgi:hypothetical protein